jgi:predicted CoA-binding protein
MEPVEILKNAKSILLIDWPNKAFVRKLLEARFEVYGYSPDKYSRAEIQDDVADPTFTTCDTPTAVDIICIYRSEAEFDGIAAKHILPLKPKAIWMQAPLISAKARAFAKEHGMAFVGGLDMAEVVGPLRSKENPGFSSNEFGK